MPVTRIASTKPEIFRSGPTTAGVAAGDVAVSRGSFAAGDAVATDWLGAFATGADTSVTGVGAAIAGTTGAGLSVTGGVLDAEWGDAAVVVVAAGVDGAEDEATAGAGDDGGGVSGGATITGLGASRSTDGVEMAAGGCAGAGSAVGGRLTR